MWGRGRGRGAAEGPARRLGGDWPREGCGGRAPRRDAGSGEWGWGGPGVGEGREGAEAAPRSAGLGSRRAHSQ